LVKFYQEIKKWHAMEFGNLCSRLHFEFTASKDSLCLKSTTRYVEVFSAHAHPDPFTSTTNQRRLFESATLERVSTNQKPLHIPNDNYSI
jgi:hypothetical protein